MAFESHQQLLIYYWLKEVSEHFSLKEDDIDYVMHKWDLYCEDLLMNKSLHPERSYYYSLVAFCESILRKFTFESRREEEEVMEIFYDLQQLYGISLKKEVTI